LLQHGANVDIINAMWTCYDVMNRTGSTEHVTMLPVENRATAIDHMQEKIAEIWTAVLTLYKWRDTHTDTFIAMQLLYALSR